MVLLNSSPAALGQIQVGTADPMILCIVKEGNTDSKMF